MLSPTVELQRSVGKVRLEFTQQESKTNVTSLYQQGCYKARFPCARPTQAVLVNTAGGMTDGDVLHAEIAWLTGASAIVTTQAAERIYRSRDGTARVENRLSGSSGTEVCWIPQETIVFDGARLTRSTQIRLSKGSKLFAAESLVFGRSAMGEVLRNGRITDCWRVMLDGSLVFADAIQLGMNDTAGLDLLRTRPAVMNEARAITTLLYVADDMTTACALVRELIAESPVTGGASLLGRLLVVRLAACDAMELRNLVTALYEALWQTALPRVWNC